MIPGFLTDWLKALIGARQQQRATDMRIGDKAKQLRRSLAATFEDYGPDGPKTQADWMSWAVKFVSGFHATDPLIATLLDLRPDASGRVQRAVADADRHYHRAADVINPLMRPTFTVSNANRVAVMQALEEALWQVRACLAVLDTIATK